MKTKFKKLLKNQSIVYTALCFLIVVFCAIIHFIFSVDINLSSLFDIGMFSTVVLVFIVNGIAAAIAKHSEAKQEDEDKLTQDYDRLCKLYKANTELVIHVNKTSLLKNIKVGRKHTKCKREKDKSDDTYFIPIANPIFLQGTEVVINDNYEKYYTLPQGIDKIRKEIFSAHAHSKTYNQLNIRLDKLERGADKTTLHCSRTTYFDSLATNRAMDFKVNGISVRDLYAYGPFLCPLEKSQLSNHLGFGGLVETKDNYFVFILRHKRVSISKNALQISVGASLKTKYALNKDMLLTKDGIVKAMREEIADELNLTKLECYSERKDDIFNEFSFDNIYYAYRELVEGGKPQLLFYTKINLELEELKKAYSAGISPKKVKNKEISVKVDGYKAIFVHRSEMKDIYITPDGITIKGKFYKSVPTVTGSLSLLMKHIGI